MITFDKGNERFNFRTAAVIIHDDKVLLHRLEKDYFWALPGGRVELGESSEAAIVREMNEEIELPFKVKRLLWVLENFSSHDNKRYHELSTIFLLQCLSETALLERGNEFINQDEGSILIFKWFNISAIKSEPVYPLFLRASLSALPKNIKYVVHEDADE